MTHSTPLMANYAAFIKKPTTPSIVAEQTEMLTTDIVKHQGASQSGGTCAGGGMRCGPRSIFVWYTAADAAGNADGVKPTTRPNMTPSPSELALPCSDVSLMMTTGAKAGQMHTAMTNVVAQQHEAAGEDPLAYKLPGGGIEGVCV